MLNPNNRRGFLGSLTAFAAACALDPERALWVPGKKLISIPKAVATVWALRAGDIVTFENSPEEWRVSDVRTDELFADEAPNNHCYVELGVLSSRYSKGRIDADQFALTPDIRTIVWDFPKLPAHFGPAHFGPVGRPVKAFGHCPA